MSLDRKGANMDFHSNIHRELVKERQQESAKEQRERKAEMNRDRQEFLASGDSGRNAAVATAVSQGMKTYAVAYSLSSGKDPASTIADYAYPRAARMFLVDAETPKKAQNAVKRYCEKQGLNVIRINEGVETERLPSA